jgi:hypothetical protein
MGLANNQVISTFTTTGTITDVGEVDCFIGEIIITDGDGIDVTNNYEITKEDGTLKVTPRYVTIKPRDEVKIYDGTPLVATSWEIVPGSLAIAPNQDVSEITYSDRIEIEREWIFSRDAENGKVISQEPYAGARRKVTGGQTCHVTVFIGLGEKRDSIPELSGKDQLSAAAILRSMGARVRTVPVCGDGPDGQIIGTSPMQGTKIKTGDAVTLFISRKRVDAPICVPDFIGMERQDAVTLALSIGLYIGYIDEGEGGDIVTRQSIPEGARVLCGCYISFTVG